MKTGLKVNSKSQKNKIDMLVDPRATTDVYLIRRFATDIQLPIH
jgi:hypothetical protein